MENQKEPASKTYRVRVPMYLSKLLDEKLKEKQKIFRYSTRRHRENT